MNVHIVSRDLHSERILGRMARMLAAATGWTLSPEPRSDAELNHFICYIEQAELWHGWRDTPLSAWFTHYETQTAAKCKWWELAAEVVDLRLTSAAQYVEMLKGAGPTAVVTPSLERGLFPLQPPTGNKTPVLGFSGFIADKSGRKGPDLARELVGKLKGPAQFVASGQGWPCRCAKRNLSELPAFYASIDILACTSLIEGLPMPPLEALASGRSVVIPRGVGLLDDLPDIVGITRYQAGSAQELTEAALAAIDELPRVNPQALRRVASRYSLAEWGATHRRAVEKLLHGEPAGTGQCGVYYVAFGGPSRKCAQRAIESWKKHMDEPAALAAVEPLGPEDVFIQMPDRDIGGRKAKLSAYKAAPADWEYVLYLDADTEIVKPVSFLFEALKDGWELVICKNPQRYHLTRYMERPDNKDECDETFAVMGTDQTMQLNGGVFGFRRCERVKRFFEVWNEEWERWGKRDQAALLRALWRVPLRVYVLGNEWNTVPHYMNKAKTAGILHYPTEARRWTGLIQGRLDSKEAWGAVK